MSYTRDWDEADPIDHTKFKNAPGEIRDTKVDIGERLKNILYGFTSGETYEGIKLGRFIKIGTGAQTAPSGTGAASALDLFARVNGTGSVMELYCQGGTGGELQLMKIGTDGLAKIPNASLEDPLLTVLAAAYPVGSIYMNASVSTDPATLLGFGTWAALGAGRVLLGNGGGYTAGDTGGAATVTLTTNEMPSHSHGIKGGTNTTSSGYVRYVSDNVGDVANTDATGGGGAHNNLQPYLVVYMWRRDS